MKGYKGFDKNFCCRGMQYKVGETYEVDGKIKICQQGYHFCDIPLAVFEYYPPVDGNRYALIEATGDLKSDDSHKRCTNKITIVRELTLAELIGEVDSSSSASNTGDRSSASNTDDYSSASNTGDRSLASNTGNRSLASNTGNRSSASNTGDYSSASNTGDYSLASNSGDCSLASVSGKQSVAIVIGKDGKAKGALGCWIVLAEWGDDEIIDMQLFKVDGEKIKPDTFYTLKNGKPCEVAED